MTLRRIALLLLALAPGLSLAQEPPPSGEPNPRVVVGAPEGPTLGGVALDEQAKTISGLLRCPVCQGLSVADSPSSMAVQMRGEVRHLVAAGYSREQVLRYFEHSYGEFVRLQPKFQGVNWIVWLAPLAALGAGLFLIRRVLNATASTVAETAAPTSKAGESVDDLAPYLEQVREAARERAKQP